MAGTANNRMDPRTLLIRVALGVLLAVNCAAGFANAWFLYKPAAIVATATVAPALIFALVVFARGALSAPDDTSPGTRMYAFTLCVLLAINITGLGRVGSIMSGPYHHNVRFDTPPGWKRLPLDRKTMIAWMVSPESPPDAPIAMIIVEAGACGDKDLSLAVDEWMKKRNGRKVSARTELGGVPALKVTLDRSGKRVQPVEAILAVHRKNLFMIIAGTDDSNPDYHDALDCVRTSWEWAATE